MTELYFKGFALFAYSGALIWVSTFLSLDISLGIIGFQSFKTLNFI